MSNKIKHYISGIHTGLTAGWNTNDAESIIGLLKSIFVNGFNSKTPSSITRSGSTVTVYVSTGHGFSDKQVVLVSGCAETEYNGEFTITYVDANNFTYTCTGTPATPATGTITVKAAPLGWTEVYSTTNKWVIRSPNTAGSQMYYRFEEPATMTTTRSITGSTNSLAGMKVVKVGMYSAMASVDVGVLECEGYIHKNPAASTATGRGLIVIGDDTTAHILTQYDNASPIYMLHTVGDMIPLNPADKWCALLVSKYGFSATSDTVLANMHSATLHGFATTGTSPSSAQFPRFQDGRKLGPFLANFAGYRSDSSSVPSAGQSMPPVNYFGGVRRGFPVYVRAFATDTLPVVIRGVVPGLYQTATMTAEVAGYEFITNAAFGSVSPAVGLMVKSYNNSGGVYAGWTFDITGPWR